MWVPSSCPSSQTCATWWTDSKRSAEEAVRGAVRAVRWHRESTARWAATLAAPVRSTSLAALDTVGQRPGSGPRPGGENRRRRSRPPAATKATASRPAGPPWAASGTSDYLRPRPDRAQHHGGPAREHRHHQGSRGRDLRPSRRASACHEAPATVMGGRLHRHPGQSSMIATARAGAAEPPTSRSGKTDDGEAGRRQLAQRAEALDLAVLEVGLVGGPEDAGLAGAPSPRRPAGAAARPSPRRRCP